LLLSVVMFDLALALPAAAGAATGMPSPFMSPFPDFGCCERCARHGAISWRCPGFSRQRDPYHWGRGQLQPKGGRPS
jgi:hypothetical protein